MFTITSKYAPPAMALAIVGVTSANADDTARKLAYDANVDFYERNWTTNADDLSCSEGYLRCFKNGDCLQTGAPNFRNSYSLEAADEYGDQVDFSGVTSFEIDAFGLDSQVYDYHVDHPLWQKVMPHDPIFPIGAVRSKQTLEIHYGDDQRKDGILISDRIYHSDGSSQVNEYGSDPTYYECQADIRTNTDTFQLVQTHFEAMDAVYKLATINADIQKQLYDFWHFTIGEAESHGVGEETALKYIALTCQQCDRYKNMHLFMQDALMDLQEKKLTSQQLRKINKSLSNYLERHQSALDGLPEFAKGHFAQFLDDQALMGAN